MSKDLRPGEQTDGLGDSNDVPSTTPSQPQKAPSRGSFLDSVRRNSRSIALATTLGLAGGAGVVGAAAGCSGIGMESDGAGGENVGEVQQKIWTDAAVEPTCGQTGSNHSPFVVWKTATDGVLFFSSDKASPGDYDLYYCTTGDSGNSWSAEQLVDGTSLNKINVVGGNEESPVYVGGKLYFTSDQTAVYTVYSIDYDLSTFKTTSAVTTLPSGVGKINSGDVEYIQLSPDGTKLYAVATIVGGARTYVTDIGVWNLDPTTDKVAGLPSTGHAGVALWSEGGKNYIGVSVGSVDCPKVGNGNAELCRWELTDPKTATAATKTNFDDIPTGVKVNSPDFEFTPMVDSKGILWYASGPSGALKLKRRDPVVVVPPDAGVDADASDASDAAVDTDAGDGGPDVDAGDAGDGGPDVDAGDAGDGGPDVDAGDAGDGGPDVDAGDAGDGGPDVDAGDAGDGGPDVDAGPDGGEGGSDAGKPCPVTAETISGTCEVTSCDSFGADMKVDGNCNFNLQPAGITHATTMSMTGTGTPYLNGGQLHPGEGVAAYVTHPKGTDAQEIALVYQVDNGSDLELGLLGTKVGTGVEKTADDRILTIKVDQDKVEAKLAGVPIQGFDFDHNGVDDNGIIDTGFTARISLKNAANLTNPTQVPDGGQTITPNPPGEGGGCSICSVGEGIGNTHGAVEGLGIFGLGLGLMALRRRKGFVGAESSTEKEEE